MVKQYFNKFDDVKEKLGDNKDLAIELFKGKDVMEKWK